MVGCAEPDVEPPIVILEPDEPKTGEVVTLALKFKPGETTTYRLITENTNGLEFEGKDPKDPSFIGGETGTRIEMEFTEEIQSVDEKGNASAKITIKALKYLAKHKSVTTIDFDSSEGKEHLLGKLIGQSYTIEITPAGKVGKSLTSQKQGAPSAGVLIFTGRPWHCSKQP
jgi:hypothetical protein